MIKQKMQILGVIGIIFAGTLWAGEIVQTVNFSPGDLVFSRAQNFDVVELKGYPAGTKLGEPRLPQVVQALVIPAGATPTAVEIISEDLVDIPGIYHIVPTQPDVPLPMPGKTFIPKEVKPDSKIYSSDKLYPEIRIRLSGAGTLNGYRIAHIEIYPLNYIPAQGKLNMITRLTCRVKYNEHQVPDNIPTLQQQKIFGDEVRSLVVNPQNVMGFAPKVNRGLGSPLLPPGNYQYVIITAPPMDTVFQRLANWKTKKGIPATLVLVSWINSNYTGYDLQEKIRNFIIDASNTWGTIYVLLGGSADHKTSGQNIVPSREAFYTQSNQYNYPDEDTMPADLYYSDLDRNWDFNNNHTWGQIADSVNMYADVYVGRAPVYNVAQAQNFVYKILTYEKNPPTSYIKKMMLPTAILWSIYEERPMQDSVARMTPTGWIDAKMYERTGQLSHARMVDSMNVGYGMGHWEGHGDEDGIYIGATAYLSSSDADALTNLDKEGIANSIACMCGGWDLTPGGNCFAEHLVNRVGGGLVATMMNSRYGWGAYVGGYVPGPSERIDTTFYAKIFEAGMYKLGAVHAAAKDAWVPYADAGNQYQFTRWCIYELNLFGDPELPLLTDVPTNLTVNFPAAIPVGNQNVNIIVMSGGNPVNNALVCLRKGTETYASGYTDGTGTVALNVNPITPGLMDITVTAKNHYPFENTIMVIQPNYAYLMYLKSSINDPAPGGNNNGQLNPGEAVDIPLWVKNLGLQTGNGIQGILRMADPFVTLSDTIKTFGNILPNDSAYTGSDGFNLNVASSVPDGHAILCTLFCKDNVDSNWTSTFTIMAYSPILLYQSVSVVGGNDNGILDPGETANLIVSLKNNGSATADNVTTTLLTSSSWVAINDASGNFGTINPGGIADNSADPYIVTADSTTPTGTMVQLRIAVVAGGYVDTLMFTIVVGKKHYYLWNPDKTPTPGQNMHTILGGLGYSGDYGTALAPDLNFYQAVLVCAGVYSNNKIIGSGSPEATALVDFLQNHGGRVYLEGGDVWYYDPSQGGYDFCLLFGINAVDDGSSDMGPVLGEAGVFTSGMDFGYGGENNFMDHIDSAGSGFLIFHDEDDGYNCGVANDAGTYRTAGTSFELGLLTDGAGVSTRAALLDSIMHFFGIHSPGGIVEDYGLTAMSPVPSFAIAPNPFSNRLRIAYSVGRNAKNVELKIFDIAGRLVKDFSRSTIYDLRSTSIVWNGTDDSGRAVPAGIYFVRFVVEPVGEVGGYEQIEKVILLR